MRALSRLVPILVILLAMGSLLSACNTTQGVGKDLSNAGQSISNAAERNK